MNGTIDPSASLGGADLRAETDGNSALLGTLSRWGIRMFTGVNGGGIIHLLKYLEPLDHLDQAGDHVPRFLTVGEYVSGYAPLGHYLATGRIAGAIATTGAATKLMASGISDAKLHNIPALYLVALNSTASAGLAPLQDVTDEGINIVSQLRAELADACVVLDGRTSLEAALEQTQRLLRRSRPAVLAFHPDALLKCGPARVPWTLDDDTPCAADVDEFLRCFPARTGGKRVVVWATQEAAGCPGIEALVTELASVLRAPVVWSINGAGAISRDNPYAYGHLMFGGNDLALELWSSLGPEDTVLALGFDPGEYCLNLGNVGAGAVWHFTCQHQSYGSRHGGFEHRVAGEYHRVRGDIAKTLRILLPRLRELPLSRPSVELPQALNRPSPRCAVKRGCVDLQRFYERLSARLRPRTIAFDDVCVAYRDRPYVMQRPHPHARFHTLYQGSAMGGAFGLGLGAKLADPTLSSFVFSGDGCFRLYAGALAETAELGMRLFVLNNGTFGIVEQGLKVILPGSERRYYHGQLRPLDFVALARASGWSGVRVEPDLGNLDQVMDECYHAGSRSLLIEVPVDPDQELGKNPRLRNLTVQTYL